MQAHPDEIGKMDFKHRRVAYCGKFSVTDVFEQYPSDDLGVLKREKANTKDIGKNADHCLNIQNGD